MIPSHDKKRLLGVGFFLVFLFLLLIIRYFDMQMIDGEKWTKIADKQHYFIVKEPFERGTFYVSNHKRHGHPEKTQKLVVDIEKFHLMIDPQSLPALLKKEIASTLFRLVNIPKDDEIHFNQQFYRKSRSRKLAEWLDPEQKNSILEWWNPYSQKHKIPTNALFFVSDYKRSYPFGGLLGQVLHTVQDIKEESTHQASPTGGLELYFNSYLKGKLGKQRRLRSPRHAMETGDILSFPENGADIYLTIDLTLQSIAEEELEKGVKKCKAKCGWAVMMNPYTGEILALAQYPFFYPQDYQKYFNDPFMIQHTKVKAVTDANEVGSVMKPMTMACALLANKELEKRGEGPLFSIEEKIACSNGRFPGRSKPIKDTRLHPFLNMDMALQRSSNIYVARLVERIINRLGADWYRNVLKNVFGFSLKTGIELPSESSGILPTPGKPDWSVSTPFSIAFGYNLQANSLQILRAGSVIANGGYLVQPTLIQKIMKGDQLLYERKEEKRKVLDQEITERVTQGMKYATKPKGTCRKGDVAGYTETGKSSTCKKLVNGIYSDVLYIGSFMGFVPAKNPAFIVIISMDEPDNGPGGEGGACTSPVFKEIARRSLSYLGIPPDDPHGYPVGDPRYDPHKADWVLENQRLNELYQKWNG